MTDVPRRHIELYEELCQRMQDKFNPGGPKLTPFEGWVNDDMVLDHIVNEGGIDEVRIVVHNCYDGDGYFWSCGGWYRRDSRFVSSWLGRYTDLGNSKPPSSSAATAARACASSGRTRTVCSRMTYRACTNW